MNVGQARHVHVDTSGERLIGRVFTVFGIVMSHKAADSKCIGENKALETPVLAQNISQQPMIAAGGDLVEVHVCAHEAACTCLLGCVEGHQIDVLQQFFRHIHRVIIATAFGCAIASKVLYADHRPIGVEMVPLEALDLGSRHGCTQVWVFSGAFDDASPAGVAGDVNHRSEHKLKSGRARILRSEMLRLLLDRWVPRRCHRERNRKDCAVPMDDIKPEDNGNVQTGFFDSDMLEPIDLLHIHLPKN